MKILYGKHIGKELTDVPTSYLIFLIEENEDTNFVIKEECKRIIFSRLNIQDEDNAKQFYFDEYHKTMKYIAYLEKDNHELTRKLAQTIDLYKTILKIHGIVHGYFSLMGARFAYVLWERCKRDNAIRLPDTFYKTGQFGKSEFQLYTKD